MKSLAMLLLCALGFSLQAQADDDELRLAVENNDLSTVRQIIESGAATVDQVVWAEGYSDGAPIITLAARAGSVEVAEYLIAHKCDLNAMTPVGETALALASFFNDNISGGIGNNERNFHIVRDLVEAGANLENPGHYSAVSYASYPGNNNVLQYLLDKGAKVDSDASDGRIATNTGLMFAARNDLFTTALLLLDHDADPRVVNSKDHDAMYFAVNSKSTDITPYIQCALDLKPGQHFKNACH